MSPTKACSDSRDSLVRAPPKGPVPFAVAATAIAETRQTPSATPLGRKRNAIHTRQGSGRKVSGLATPCMGEGEAKTNAVETASSVNDTMTSPSRQGLVPICIDCRQVRKTGANTTMPIRSPSHQVCQESRKFADETTPAKLRVAAPQVEAMRQAAAAMPVKRSVAGPDSKIFGTPTQRSSAAAQASAWTVEPAAIETAMRELTQVNSTAAVVNATARFTSREPIAMPGQTRGPQSSRAASAMPDGGHTAVA